MARPKDRNVIRRSYDLDAALVARLDEWVRRTAISPVRAVETGLSLMMGLDPVARQAAMDKMLKECADAADKKSRK